MCQPEETFHQTYDPGLSCEKGINCLEMLSLYNHEVPEDSTFNEVVPAKLGVPFHVYFVVQREVIAGNISQGLVTTSTQISFEH